MNVTFLVLRSIHLNIDNENSVMRQAELLKSILILYFKEQVEKVQIARDSSPLTHTKEDIFRSVFGALRSKGF